MRRVVFLVMSIPQLLTLAKVSYNILSNSLHEKLYIKKNSQTTHVTFIAQFKRDQKIIIVSRSLALTLFQRVHLEFYRWAGLESRLHLLHVLFYDSVLFLFIKHYFDHYF